MTYTYTSTKTFTRTSAQYIASKVAADLRRMYDFYGKPLPQDILNFYGELVEVLYHGHLESAEYGFQRSDQRIVSLKYTVERNGTLSDSHAGGVHPRADITGARWFSYMTYSSKWWSLTQEQRRIFKAKLPIARVSGDSPANGKGYWTADRGYSADGVGTQRHTFRPY